jgi:hypothetical protein
LRLALAFTLIATLTGMALPAWGQQITAAITGSVVDPSGAPVVGARVVAVDVERGLTYPVKTNSLGIYVLPQVPVGNYKLQVEAEGFEKTVYPTFVLILNQTARFDVKLKVGKTTETVEVTGSAPLLQTDTTQLSTLIDATTTDSLPLATRNYVQLAMLTPGAVNPDPASFGQGMDMTTSGRPYINGNRQQENNFMLDGIDNNQIGDNEVGYQPNIDAIQEFNVITQNASADFGNFMGGIVSATIKSGTNSVHGDLFEYFRNDALNANSWQNGWTNTPKAPLRWNMFGGTVGGPVIKNKMFFFADYQGQRQDHPSKTGYVSLIPTAVQGGDLRYMCTTAFVGGICQDHPMKADGVTPDLTQFNHQLYNPLNVVGGQRQPFLNNQIPTGMISSVATNLFASKYYPSVAGSQTANNYATKTSQQFNNDQGDLKIDYNLSQKDRLFGRWSQMYLTEPESSSWALSNWGGGNMTDQPGKNLGIGWTHTITPKLLNDFRTGFNWVDFQQYTSPAGVGNLASDIGITNGNTAGPGFPFLNIGGFAGIGNIGAVQYLGDTVIQVSDSLAYNHGRHLFHVGVQFNRYRLNTTYAGNSGAWGEMDFGGGFTQGVNATGDAFGGNPVADFLLGMPTTVAKGGASAWRQRSSEFSVYGQDDWRFNNELTLNLGLRYENHTPWVENDNHQVNFGMYTGAVEFAGQNGNSRGLYNSYNGGTDFQPRIGLAYSPKALHGKSVFRAAYTLSSYVEGMGVNNRLSQNIPFVPADLTSTSLSTGTSLPNTTTDQGFPAVGGSGGYTGITQFAGAAIRVWDPKWRPAVSQQWNFSVQQQLSRDTTLQFGYVGQHGTHLTNFYWANQKILHSDGTTTPGPYVAGNPTLKNEIGAIRMTLSNGGSEYHAFQAVLDKRMSNGLQGQLSYTLSNCQTDAVGFYGNWTASQTDIGMPSPQDIYNPQGDWGKCNFDVLNVLTGYVNYALPFGKGKTFGGGMPAVANAIIGNWEISSIMSIHSGFAMNMVDGWIDPAGTGSYMERPNVTGKVSYPKTRVQLADGTYGIQWVNNGAFTQAPNGQFGTEKVGDLRGPGLTNFDMSLHKDFPFGEGRRVQFRAEAMNVFNHPVLYLGAGNLYIKSFAGNSSGVLNQSRDERNLQLALKIYF